ncbi:MAG: hypothetical protein ACO3JL_06335 [Myxococcota bacterium]
MGKRDDAPRDGGHLEGVELDEIDGVLRIPGERSAAWAGRLCRRRGYLLPLPRPLPSCSIATLCTRLPYLVDAYVTGVDARLPSGTHVVVPHSPRGAVGPDLLGLVCARATAAVVRQVTLRVIAQGEACLDEYRCDSVDEAAATVVSRVTEGRAFAVMAYVAPAGVTVRSLGGPRAATLPSPPIDVFRRWRWPHGRVHAARNLLPGDIVAIAAALARGEVVHGAPFVGRVAALSSSTWSATDNEPFGLAGLWESRGRSHE